MYLWLICAILWFIAFSCRWNWWRREKQGIPILMYHYIGDAPRNAKNKKLWVSAKQFRQQMEYLKKHNYYPITFKELILVMRNEMLGISNSHSSLSSRPSSLNINGDILYHPVIITFDDGAQNNYQLAFQILKEYNFKACMFLPSLRHEFSREQLREMQDYGIEFGSHTQTHPNLLKITETQVRAEIENSKKELEENLNTQIIAFAYPYGVGAYNEKINQIVKEAGYTYACSTKQGKVTLPITDRYRLKRLLVRGDDLMIDFILNLKKGRSRL